MWDKGASNVSGEISGGTTITTAGATNGQATNQHPNEKFAQLCNLLDILKNPNLIIVEPTGFATFKTVRKCFCRQLFYGNGNVQFSF